MGRCTRFSRSNSRTKQKNKIDAAITSVKLFTLNQTREKATLLLPLDRLLCHLNKTVLGFTLGKVGNSGNGFFRVVLRKSSGLLYAIALQYQLAGL